MEDENGTEIFVHHNDIEMDGYRYLRRGQMVSFVLIDKGDGPKAIDVLVESEPVVEESSEPRPVIEGPLEAGCISGEIMRFEEDREHEFKSVQNSRDPVRTICEHYVEKYVNAFLNTNGGTIHFGVGDDGSVHGIHLDRSDRDRLRTEISKLINKFQPAVEPDLYEIKFMKINDRDSKFVVEIRVSRGWANLYMTGSQNFYLRRDGSNFLMPFDMIRARLETPPKPPAAPAERTPTASDADLEEQLLQTASSDLDLGILLSMVFMSWSAESITDTERDLIIKRAQDEGLDEHEVNMLLRATVQPPLLENIVSYLPTPESRKAAATIAYLTALSDSVLTVSELQAFDLICGALGLSEKDRKEIRTLGEQQVGLR